MLKLFLITLLLLSCSASAARAQTSDEQPKNEFFAGYSFNSADINTLTVDPGRTGQHGLNLSYTRYVTPRVGLTLDASAHFKRDRVTFNAREFERKRDEYHIMGGVQFKASGPRKVKPFAHALVGAALFRGFASSETAAGNLFIIDDAQSLALAFGGGLDVRASKHVDIRIIQADYLPTFFGSGRQDNLRISVGIVFRR